MVLKKKSFTWFYLRFNPNSEFWKFLALFASARMEVDRLSVVVKPNEIGPWFREPRPFRDVDFEGRNDVDEFAWGSVRLFDESLEVFGEFRGRVELDVRGEHESGRDRASGHVPGCVYQVGMSRHKNNIK